MPTEVHLQMIQAVVARLSSQSTTVKGWCVTVASALLGFGANSTRPAVAVLAVYVVAAFAALDAYYLSLERAYRTLYQRAVDGTTAPWQLDIDRPGYRRSCVPREARRSPSCTAYRCSRLPPSPSTSCSTDGAAWSLQSAHAVIQVPRTIG
ncbi:hypothetical protein ACGF3C_02135 [Micromonospora sp. NPDC047762]|uniref:hypothetical protein n=1 Tax=Micromonospora sp. NPDC047762 TaxID=3364255 RepID=UPI0037220148